MTNFLALLSGDLKRMGRYHILTAGLVAALLWIGILYVTEIEEVTFIFPLLLFVDAVSMSMVLIGAVMFFERQESSIKSILVSPVSKEEYILSKSLATVFSGLITLVLLYLYVFFCKEIAMSFIGLLGAVALVSFFHALVGFILTYYSRDFTSLLMNMMKYIFVFFLPVILEFVGILQHDFWENVVYVAPTKASMLLLLAPAGGLEAGELVYSLL